MDYVILCSIKSRQLVLVLGQKEWTMSRSHFHKVLSKYVLRDFCTLSVKLLSVLVMFLGEEEKGDLETSQRFRFPNCNGSIQ